MQDRLTQVEMLLMHLQKTLQDLDDVIRGQGSRLKDLERDMKRINQELGLLRERAFDERSAEEEKPPHY